MLVVYCEHRFGETWLHPINGQVYMFMGLRWVPTGHFPYGPDPMGFL
jgi:hypothetical protein